MAKIASTKRNVAYNTIYELITVLISFITGPYVARVLTPERIGVYSYVNSYSAYFDMFATLGTAAYGSRVISRLRDDSLAYSKAFWEIKLVSFFTSFICLLLWQIVVFTGQSEYRIYYIILSLNVIHCFMNISWLFTGLERFRLLVTLELIVRLASTACIYIFVRQPADLTIYVLLLTGSNVISDLLLWLNLPKLLSKVHLHTLKPFTHIKGTIAFFLPAIASSIASLLDVTLLGALFEDKSESGYYYEAEKIISMIKRFVYKAINAVVGIRSAYLFGQKKFDELKAYLHKSLDFIMLIGIGAIFGIAGISFTFVPLYLGSGYEAVITLLFVLAPLVIIQGTSNALSAQYYTAAGRRAECAKYIMAGSIVNLILNIIFIPLLGALGACITTLIAEIITSILYVKNCDSYILPHDLWRFARKRLLAGAVMFVCVYLMGFIKLPAIVLVVIQLGVGCCIYFATLILIKDAAAYKYTHLALDTLKRFKLLLFKKLRLR